MRLTLVRVACTLAVLAAAPVAAGAAGSGRTTVPIPFVKLPLTGIGQLGAKTSKTHTCQAGGSDRRSTSTRSALVGTPRKSAVVACEQPPRSQLLLPQALGHAGANALATVG